MYRRRRFDAATLVVLCFVFLACTSATSTTKQTDLRSFVVRAAVAKDGVVVDDSVSPPPPVGGVVVDVTNAPPPPHGTTTTGNDACSGPHTDGAGLGTSSGGARSGGAGAEQPQPQPSVVAKAKKRKRRVVEEEDDEEDDEKVVASKLVRVPLGDLKPGKYCRGHPNNAAQCLNANGKRKLASFGYDHKEAFFCKTCAVNFTSGYLPMRDVKNRMCVVCEQTRPVFGMPDDDRATHCSKCKLNGMVDIISRMCVVCKKTQPAFGMPDDERSTHCKKCKLSGMVNIVSRKCVVCEQTVPSFGMSDDKRATHCSKCKLNDMVDIKHCKCVVCEQTQPFFGMPDDERATHCGKCKISGMVDMKNNMCVANGCKTRSHVHWAPYCAGCYAELHPDDTLVCAHNKTEAKIKLFLNDTLGAGITSVSDFNMMNVRGSRAVTWLGRYEIDFLLFGGRVAIACHGGQHRQDVAYFKKTAAEERANDVHKTVLQLDHDVSEVVVDQEDIWYDRFDWRALLTGMIAYAVTMRMMGIAVFIVARRNETDDRYAPHVDDMLKTRFADRIHEAFLESNERGLLTVIHRASGTRSLWRIPTPTEFSLARWPSDPDKLPMRMAEKTQSTLDRFI